MSTDVPAIEIRFRDVLLGSDEGRRHIAFFSAIPDALVPWMAPFWWESSRLFALDLPVSQLPITELRQFLAVPYWRASKSSDLFQLTARDVLADPETHATHWQRTLAVDLRYPLTCYRMGERLLLLDGFHRLLKAQATGVDSLPVMVVPEMEIDSVLVRDGFLGELNTIRNRWIAHQGDLIPTYRRIARSIRAEHPAGTFPDW